MAGPAIDTLAIWSTAGWTGGWLDFSKTHFHSYKGAMTEARRVFRCRQTNLLERLAQPTWAMLIEEAWLKGELPPVPLYDDFDAWTQCLWKLPASQRQTPFSWRKADHDENP